MNELVASKTVVTWAVNIIKSSYLLPLFSSLIKEYCSRRIQSASLQPFPFMRQRRTLTLFFFLLLLHWFPFYSWSQAYQFSNESVKEPWGCRGTKRAAICKSIAALLNRSAWDGKKKTCLLMCTQQLNLLSEYWWDIFILELSLIAEVS